MRSAQQSAPADKNRSADKGEAIKTEIDPDRDADGDGDQKQSYEQNL